MPCTPFTLPDGTCGILCSRAPHPRCACGHRASLQCDAPVGSKGRACSRHICTRCATEIGPDLHLCPDRAAAPAQKAIEF